MIFIFLPYHAYVGIVFGKAISKFTTQENDLLTFKNSGKSKYSQKACNG